MTPLMAVLVSLGVYVLGGPFTFILMARRGLSHSDSFIVSAWWPLILPLFLLVKLCECLWDSSEKFYDWIVSL